VLHLHASPSAAEATRRAADLLCSWLGDPMTRAVMVAGGNTPLPLYAEVAGRLARGEAPGRISLYVLDEYVGVPPEHPRTCTNLLRRTVAEAWGLPAPRFFGLSPAEGDALERLRAHELAIAACGGLDAIVLGLGANGHLGFNEPGSPRVSGARLVDLEPASIEANRAWFGGAFAPRVGATVGLRTILASRRALVLAFGEGKAAAVGAMLEGPVGPACPASFLRDHPEAHVFVDEEALGGGPTG
jgi:glucosamine-6-phosphate deaminase